MKALTKIMAAVLPLLLLFTSTTAFAAPDYSVMAAKVGTKSNPIKTAAQLDTAFKNLKAGDVIYIGAVTITMNKTIEISRNNITIKGAGQNKTILKNPKAGGRHFTATGNNTVFEDMTLKGPGVKVDNKKFYGGIEAKSLTLNRCTVAGHSDYRYASPRPSVGATTLNMKDCTVKNNSGAVCGRSINLTNCVIANNSLNMQVDNYMGGGINLATGTLTNCVITGNKAGEGGGVYIGKSANIINCTISGNTATDSGSGVCAWEGVNLINCTISGNEAKTHGGGVCAWKKANLTNCTVYGNKARNGGGLFTANASLTNCTITANTASELGGGVSTDFTYGTYPEGKLDIRGSIIAGNTAPAGADVHHKKEAMKEELPTAPNYNIIGGNIGDIFAAVRNGSAVLNNNGGSTQTVMIKPGGIAHDAIPTGTAWLPSTDQRNVSRPRGAGGDIGAVETTQTAVSGAKVTVPEKETIAVGASKTIMYCTTPADLKPIWYTNKPDVISVSSTGKVKGLKKGSAYVYAKVGDSVGRCTVTVK